MKNSLIYLLLAIIASSCSPQKRLARICSKNPSLCEVSDTMRDTSYIITEFEKFDSIYITAPVDTIIVDNETVRTVIYRQHDTLRVVQTIEPDTAYVYRDKVVVRYKVKERLNVYKVIYGAAGLLGLYLLLLMFKYYGRTQTET